MPYSADRPNILLIMTDQHSKHFLGCYGNDLVRTPNLDRLAAQGMRFTDAYCPSPLCVPSRMSFMTSQTPSQNEVWNNNHILHSGIPTWPTLLSIAGYETALLGRMHFCGPDQLHGFESRPVGEGGAGPVGMARKGGPMWTKFPSSTSGQCRECVEVAGRGQTHYQWSDEERTRVARQWLKEKAQSPGPRPFAAVLGYTLPHCPFVARRDLFDYYYERVDIPSVEEAQPETVRRFRDLRGILDPPLPAERIRVARAAYYGLCEHIDSLIGQVLDTLEETGLADNTIVIYTSDHGEMAGEHGCWWKSNYYEGSAGIPLLARWPGMISQGSVSDAVCNLMDIGPTFADLTDTRFPHPVAGRSLCRILADGHDDEWPNETTSELVDHRGGFLASRMVRSGPWKLWVYGDDAHLPPSLFNLENDPGELNDLGQDSDHEDTRHRLLTRLYQDWDPSEAAKKSQRYWTYFDVLRQWGQTVKPDSPYALVYPPPEYEDDVELL
ncbi:MAG: sulfatase-like hydrolase/transferase [Candidatus Pacebacteria bacterium]|nr:sulfatase-like hydrolase/transferase [Candidatus Paceibacterota bacterium]